MSKTLQHTYLHYYYLSLSLLPIYPVKPLFGIYPQSTHNLKPLSLAEAKSHAEAGKRPPKDDRELELPDELVEALDADPEMAEAFHALTRGRQKSYVINLSSAKKSETRANRIKTYRDRIIEGKGATER